MKKFKKLDDFHRLYPPEDIDITKYLNEINQSTIPNIKDVKKLESLTDLINRLLFNKEYPSSLLNIILTTENAVSKLNENKEVTNNIDFLFLEGGGASINLAFGFSVVLLRGNRVSLPSLFSDRINLNFDREIKDDTQKFYFNPNNQKEYLVKENKNLNNTIEYVKDIYDIKFSAPTRNIDIVKMLYQEIINFINKLNEIENQREFQFYLQLIYPVLINYNYVLYTHGFGANIIKEILIKSTTRLKEINKIIGLDINKINEINSNISNIINIYSNSRPSVRIRNITASLYYPFFLKAKLNQRLLFDVFVSNAGLRIGTDHVKDFYYIGENNMIENLNRIEGLINIQYEFIGSIKIQENNDIYFSNRKINKNQNYVYNLENLYNGLIPRRRERPPVVSNFNPETEIPSNLIEKITIN